VAAKLVISKIMLLVESVQQKANHQIKVIIKIIVSEIKMSIGC